MVWFDYPFLLHYTFIMPEQPDKKIEQLPSEGVSAEEYKYALENLARFAEKDVNAIKTLRELTWEMRFVGRGLRSVILSNGKVQRTEFTRWDFKRGKEKVAKVDHFILEPVREEIEFSASLGEGKVHLGQSKIAGNDHVPNFSASIPISEEIQASDDASRSMLVASATVWHNRKMINYYPAKEPNNTGTLQGYARTVQDSIKDILTIAKPPSQLSPVFNY